MAEKGSPSISFTHSMPNTKKEYKPGTSSPSRAAEPGKYGRNTESAGMSKKAGSELGKSGKPRG